MEIGSHIRQLRLKRRFSMAEVEKRANMAPGVLESLESGEMDPVASTLSVIADVLGIPVS